MLGGRYLQQPYYFLALPRCGPSRQLCMSLSPRAVLGRVRPHLQESPLLSPRAHSPLPHLTGP